MWWDCQKGMNVHVDVKNTARWGSEEAETMTEKWQAQPHYPHPYNQDPRMLMTSSDHSYISICGEWVRLPLEEVNRLTKKWRQAREIRLQVMADLPKSTNT